MALGERRPAGVLGLSVLPESARLPSASVKGYLADFGAKGPPMPRETPPLPDDGIYRMILIVLVVSLLIGAILALAGDLLWQSPGVSQAGTGLVIVSGLAYVLFRILGAREARRRARAADVPPQSEDDPGRRGGEDP